MRGGRGAARPAVVTRAWGAETIARPAGDTSKSRSPAGRRRGPARPPGQGRGAGLHVGSPGGGTSSPVAAAAAAAAAGSSPGPAGRRRGAAGRCLLPACLARSRRGGQLGGPGSPPRPLPAPPPLPCPPARPQRCCADFSPGRVRFMRCIIAPLLPPQSKMDSLFSLSPLSLSLSLSRSLFLSPSPCVLSAFKIDIL